MDTRLTMYENQQYEPLPIPNFTIVEVYQDTISPTTGLGYFIVPLTDNSQDAITEKIRAATPEGYTQFAVYTDDMDLKNKVIYAVFYQGDTPPEPPAKPEFTEQVAATPYDIYKSMEITNDGAPAYINLTIELEETTEKEVEIDFYINKNHYLITIPIVKGENIVTIDKDVVMYAGLPILNASIDVFPQLQHGVNVIKVNGLTIKRVIGKYQKKY